MIGASGILPALVITFFCFAIASLALIAAICGALFWRRKRWLSLTLLIPSVLYLAFFAYLFTPRLQSHHIANLDLRKPRDLSGIPADTKWLSASWPQPRPIVPLSPSGAFCALDEADIMITLPDGQTIRDFGQNVYIDVDDTGIWKVTVMVEGVAPKTALTNLKKYLWPIALKSLAGSEPLPQLSEIETSLQSYVPNSPIWAGLPLKLPGCKIYFGLGTTFLPSGSVSYRYLVELPHVPLYKRFTALPPIERPEQVLQDARELIATGVARNIPKEQWPSSISQLSPSSVHIYKGKLLMVFDINPETGYHCYAVGMTDRDEDRPHLFVKSTPYPNLDEVWWHDQKPTDLQ